MKRIKKILLIITILCLGWFLVSCKKEQEIKIKPISIICTSDVHTGYKDNIGYAGVKAYENKRINEGYDTILIDSRDLSAYTDIDGRIVIE